MGKLKGNIMRKLKKIKQKQSTGILTNKIVKKRLITEKKVSFKKKVILQDKATDKGSLLKENAVLKPAIKLKPTPVKKFQNDKLKPKKHNSLQKQDKRRKTSLNDAKLLLKIMKNK